MKALKLAAVTLFHPIVGFRYMKKDRTKFNYHPIWIVLLLMIFTKIFSIYVTHYPLNNVNLRNANLIIECAVMIVPVMTWVVASYAMTTIMDGEVMFRECLLACCYSLLPYIIVHIPLTLMTNVMDLGQIGWYSTINNASLLFVLVLLFINLKEMNNYTISKTFGVIFLSLCTMLVIWASILLVYALTLRFTSFISEVIVELQYKFIY